MDFIEESGRIIEQVSSDLENNLNLRNSFVEYRDMGKGLIGRVSGLDRDLLDRVLGSFERLIPIYDAIVERDKSNFQRLAEIKRSCEAGLEKFAKSKGVDVDEVRSEYFNLLDKLSDGAISEFILRNKERALNMRQTREIAEIGYERKFEEGGIGSERATELAMNPQDGLFKIINALRAKYGM